MDSSSIKKVWNLINSACLKMSAPPSLLRNIRLIEDDNSPIKIAAWIVTDRGMQASDSKWRIALNANRLLEALNDGKLQHDAENIASAAISHEWLHMWALHCIQGQSGEIDEVSHRTKCLQSLVGEIYINSSIKKHNDELWRGISLINEHFAFRKCDVRKVKAQNPVLFLDGRDEARTRAPCKTTWDTFWRNPILPSWPEMMIILNKYSAHIPMEGVGVMNELRLLRQDGGEECLSSMIRMVGGGKVMDLPLPSQLLRKGAGFEDLQQPFRITAVAPHDETFFSEFAHMLFELQSRDQNAIVRSAFAAHPTRQSATRMMLGIPSFNYDNIKSMPHLVPTLLFDVSGSMTDADTMGKLVRMAIWLGTQILAERAYSFEVNFRQISLKSLCNGEYCGGGGTDYNPVLSEVVSSASSPPRNLVIWTDGHADLNSDVANQVLDLGIRTLVVLVGENASLDSLGKLNPSVVRWR